jgi:heptosyltransferase III
VLTTPAIHLLKTARPDLRIAVAVEDRFREVFEANPDIDAILAPALRPLRSWKPRLCVNLHGGTRSAWMTALSGARFRAGYAHYRHQFVYNLRIPRAQQILHVDRTVHTAEHAASAMFYLGVPLSGIPRARLYVGQALSPAHICVIHPVAATPGKTWTPAGFLAVADHLKNSGLAPVFIGAAADDLSPFAAHRIVQGAPLSQVKQLLSAASLFVGNDSGPAHMAAAFGVPVVAIFGESDPAIWGPWQTPSEIVTSPRGIAAVAVPQVLDAVGRLGVHA